LVVAPQLRFRLVQVEPSLSNVISQSIDGSRICPGTWPFGPKCDTAKWQRNPAGAGPTSAPRKTANAVRSLDYLDSSTGGDRASPDDNEGRNRLQGGFSITSSAKTMRESRLSFHFLVPLGYICQGYPRLEVAVSDLAFIKQIVAGHLSDIQSISDVAGLTGYSPETIRKKFAREEHIPLSAYITKARVEKAKQLLLESNMTCCEISGSVGFQRPETATRAFKRLAGRTMRTYRQLSRKKMSWIEKQTTRV
jgi:AraC-like DNA-binding protein